MMNFNIKDSNEQIKLACEDLKAVQTVVTMAEDDPVYSNDHEVLIVVRRALDTIISDIRKATAVIDGEFKNVQKD